ncbi:hypothetical protein GUJ93_ZPchr0005g16336 [Zizania palustris]|uniref:Uncharacterized protein n=1 Tax=Zizania palustris TaxID=103762 RepID=A0A8J5T416_ZIZPA|nr:hypothetical protein GUJ93_ZPchr0005g16336 [Zizania palustris]
MDTVQQPMCQLTRSAAGRRRRECTRCSRWNGLPPPWGSAATGTNYHRRGERSHRNGLPSPRGACMVVGMGRRRRRGERSRQNEPPPPELDNTGKGPQRLLLRSKMNLVVTCYLHESRKVVPSTTGGEIWSGDLWVPSGRCCLSATARSGICAPHGDDDLFQQLRSPRRRRPVPTATFPTAAVVRSSGGGDAPCELGKLSYVAAWAS